MTRSEIGKLAIDWAAAEGESGRREQAVIAGKLNKGGAPALLEFVYQLIEVNDHNMNGFIHDLETLRKTRAFRLP